MLGRAVVFRCVAAAGHGMRIHAFRGGGGGCARPPVRWRLWRAVQAPGTVHVSTQNVVGTYGRRHMQDLRRLDACWWRERGEEEEQEQEEEEAELPPPLSPLCIPVILDWKFMFFRPFWRVHFQTLAGVSDFKCLIGT